MTLHIPTHGLFCSVTSPCSKFGVREPRHDLKFKYNKWWLAREMLCAAYLKWSSMCYAKKQPVYHARGRVVRCLRWCTSASEPRFYVNDTAASARGYIHRRCWLKMGLFNQQSLFHFVGGGGQLCFINKLKMLMPQRERESRCL
jgi:hypothetical protein